MNCLQGNGKLRLAKCFEQLTKMLNGVKSEGALRSEGRLRNVNFPCETKRPCLLPKVHKACYARISSKSNALRSKCYISSVK